MGYLKSFLANKTTGEFTSNTKAKTKSPNDSIQTHANFETGVLS